ncbi:thiamine pyrophosphate-binding protein [Haematomicrobium sanguinis]|uniref:thiamine pyrophosphate-binding protein n=1 Tax=Haematomicrobium sanguinis TaxID=479106 RepID=UPI00047E55BB|nr:thiamine pyrophosphate-binding protein [Haematomicrobium sanguinis]
MPTTPTVAAALANTLATHSDIIFGVMGNGNAHFLDALLKHPVRYVAMRHEVGTVGAADAYHRASGKLALATTTYGPGFTNAATTLAEARMAQTPLIMMTAQSPTTGQRPWDINQEAFAAAMGVPTLVVTGDNAATIAEQAVRMALTDRTPVILALPYDLIEKPATAATATTKTTSATTAGTDETPQPEARRENIAELATALRNARRPLILAGRGAIPAAESVRELATIARALGVTSAPARGLFTGWELDAGVAGGFASARTARLIRESDLAVVLGAGLNQFTMAFGETFAPGTRVWQMDDGVSPTHARVDSFIRADVGDGARQLIDALRGSHPRSDWDHADVVGAQDDREPGDALAPDGRLDPRSLTRRLNAILPAERIVNLDGGHFIGWPNTYLDLPNERSMILLGTAFQSIGLGFQAAVGVAAAQPDRLLATFAGDGGALMSLADLETLIRESTRTVVVIYNDAAYGAEIHQYGARGINEMPMLIDQVNFAALAQALGARADVVTTLEDLAGVESWIASDAQGLYLLDCRVSQTVVAPYIQEIIQRTLVKD